METRANYTIVGLFTLLVILLSFAFIYWVAKLDERVNLAPLNVKIRGAVTGLAAGGEVHFNGIKVGNVERVVFDADDPSVVYALTQVNQDTPIRTDTTATLSTQGLTGVAYISLKGGSPRAKSIFDTEGGAIPLINARPSAVADILETVREVSRQANEALGSLSEFIEENREPVSKTVQNVQAFSQALENNADGVDEFLKSASDIGQSLSGLGEKIDGTVKGLEKIVAAVDENKVRSTIDNIESFSKNLKDGGARVDSVTASVENIATELQAFSSRLNGSLDKFDNLLGAVETKDLKQTVADIRDTASGAKKMVEDVSNVTKTFTDRKEDIDQMVTNAREMMERLNSSSKRVDGVLVKLDGFLGSEGSQSVMTEVSSTLSEFRSVARTMQSSINNISGGLSKFSNSGLRDAQNLINDARRSIGRLDRVISSIERDPKRFIFGNSGVRTYNGRPKR